MGANKTVKQVAPAIPIRKKKFAIFFPSTVRISWEAIFLLGFPILVFLGLNYPPRIQNATLDPYVYTGYINNLTDLFHRYGITYYSVRFGLLFPAIFFKSLLGAEAGYFVLRYLLSLLFGLCLYATCRRHLNRMAAFLAFAIAVGSPYFARAILWDHPDATGVPFLTAAICLSLLDGPRTWQRNLLAGCCLGMAIHSNAFTLAVFGLFVLIHSLVALMYGEARRKIVLRLALQAAGVLLISGLGALIYGAKLGHFDIFTITFNMVRQLSQGGMQRWRAQGVDWMAPNYYIFVPVWLSACCLLIMAYKRSYFSVVVTLYGAAVTAYYFIDQLLLNADILQLFYYTSYMATAIFLMVAVILDFFASFAAKRRAIFVGVVSAAAFLPWLAVTFGANYKSIATLRWFGFSAVALLAVVVILWGARKRPSAAVMAAISCALFVFVFDLGFGNYRSIIGTWAVSDHTERDVYRVALQLIEATPKYTGDPGDLLFLYDMRDHSLDSIQSTYLWGYSLLVDPTLNVLQDAGVKRWTSNGKYLALLAKSTAELESQAKELISRGALFREVDRRTLSSGLYRVYWKLLEVDHPFSTAVANGDFESGVTAWAGGWASLRTIDGGQSGKCLELSAEQGSAQYALQSNGVKLQPGKRYTLSFWVKSGSSGDEHFVVGMWDPHASRFEISQGWVSSAKWTKYDIDFVDTTTNLLSLELMKSSPTKGSMLFDSVQLKPMD